MSKIARQPKAHECYFDEFERAGQEAVHIMKRRFSEEEGRTFKLRHNESLSQNWAPNDLCEVTRNLFCVVNGLASKAPISYGGAMMNHLPTLLLKHVRSEGLNLGQVIYKTFMDFLDYPALQPSMSADVCPAQVDEAKGTLIWWLSGSDTKAPLLIKLALAGLDAERTGWALVVLYSDDAEYIVEVLKKAFPPRCRYVRGTFNAISLSSLGVPQPPSYLDLNCFQFTRSYYNVSTTEHTIVAGGDDVVVRRPLMQSEYSYAILGAPWAWCASRGYPDWCKYGGNGGFSYRAKSFAMKYALKVDPKKNLTAWKAACGKMGAHDDGRFARSIAREIRHRGNGSLWKWAEPEVQAEFSVETIRHSNNPCGMHKTWKYIEKGMDSTYISRLLIAPAKLLGSFGYFS